MVYTVILTILHHVCICCCQCRSRIRLHTKVSVHWAAQVNKKTAPELLKAWRTNSKAHPVDLYVNNRRVVHMRNWLVKARISLIELHKELRLYIDWQLAWVGRAFMHAKLCFLFSLVSLV